MIVTLVFSLGLLTSGALLEYKSQGINASPDKGHSLHESWNNEQSSGSCTIFTVAIGETVLFGNNEDDGPEGSYIWFSPSQVIDTPRGSIATHGAVFIGFDNNDNHPWDGVPQGGMNDRGLCIDTNYLPGRELNPHPEREPQYMGVLYEILWECSTVPEAIDWFESHNLGSRLSCQLHIADANRINYVPIATVLFT